MKFRKGSPEARAYMAKIRGMRSRGGQSHPTVQSNPLNEKETAHVVGAARGAMEEGDELRREGKTVTAAYDYGMGYGLASAAHRHAKRRDGYDAERAFSIRAEAPVRLHELRGTNPDLGTFELDTRSYGPAYCETCDEELEDAMLRADGTWVCPTCRTPIAGGLDASSFVDVAAVRQALRRTRRGNPPMLILGNPHRGSNPYRVNSPSGRYGNPLSAQEVKDFLARGGARRSDAAYFGKKNKAYLAGREIGQSMARGMDVEQYAETDALRAQGTRALASTLGLDTDLGRKFNPYSLNGPSGRYINPGDLVTTRLPRVPGWEVVAKLYKGEPSAMTYSNRSQADARARELGPDWQVTTFGGRPFFVARKLNSPSGRYTNPARGLVAYHERESDDPQTGVAGILRSEWRVGTIAASDEPSFTARWGEGWRRDYPTHFLEHRYIRRGVEEPWEPFDTFKSREAALDAIDRSATAVEPRLRAIQYRRVAAEQAYRATEEEKRQAEGTADAESRLHKSGQDAFERMRGGADPVGVAAALEWQEFVGKRKRSKAELDAFQHDPSFMAAYNEALRVTTVPAKRKAVVAFLRHAKRYDPEIRVPNPAGWPAIDHSLLSPSGRMSGRARSAALAREGARLFPPGTFAVPPPSAADRALQLRLTAANLRDLAARGMKVRAYPEEAARLEAEADALERRGNPLDAREAREGLGQAAYHLRLARNLRMRGLDVAGHEMAAMADGEAAVIQRFRSKTDEKARRGASAIGRRAGLEVQNIGRRLGVRYGNPRGVNSLPIRSSNPGAKMLPPRIANDPRFKAELSAYRKRHGCDPKFITVVKTPDGSPKFASAWGKVPEIKYDAAPDASDKGRRVHRFGENGGAQPFLITSVEKGPKHLQIAGGTFRAGGEWIYR